MNKQVATAVFSDKLGSTEPSTFEIKATNASIITIFCSNKLNASENKTKKWSNSKVNANLKPKLIKETESD